MRYLGEVEKRSDMTCILTGSLRAIRLGAD